MKTLTKAATATASAGSAIGGGYTIYHFSSESAVSTEEEGSLENLSSDEVSSKILKDENDNTTNETVDVISQEKQESKSEVSETKKTTHKQVQKTVDEFSALKKNLKTYTPSDLSNGTYKDKILGITKETNLPKLVKFDDNDKWWEWAFKNKHENNKQRTTLHKAFSSLKKGYSTDESDKDALNQACKEAYKTPKSGYSFEDDNFLLSNISDFCTSEKQSFDISEPKVEAFGDSLLTPSYEGGLMSVGVNKNFLVEPLQKHDNYNDLWWNWSYKKRVKSKNNLTTHFSNLNKGYTPDAQTGLNGACHKLYGMSLDKLRKEDNKLKLIWEIKQFCSINPRQHLVIVKKEKTYSPSTFSLTVNQSLDGKYKTKILDLLDFAALANYVKPEEENNEEWWEWMYENVYPKHKNDRRFSNFFKDLNEGYSKTNSKALNKACDAAYQKDFSYYYFSHWHTLLNYMAKLCTKSDNSSEVLKPKGLNFTSDHAYFGLLKDKTGILSKTSNRSNLVPHANFYKNPQEIKYWWEWVYETRFPKSDEDKKDLSKVFKVVDTEHGGDSDRTALNQACKIAYQKELSEFKDSEENQKLLADVQKFCTVDPTLALTVQ